MKRLFYLLFYTMVLAACEQNDPDLPPAGERVSVAVEALRDELTSPNGWKTFYRPTPSAGSYFMTLRFDNDNVIIATDMAAEDGAYHEQTIPYRIDAGQGIELIFETYGAFHYLFELDQATFGAEFEFFYTEEDEGDLLFTSKSDLFDQTTMRLEPAQPEDREAFSRESAENFNKFEGQSPRLFGGIAPALQLYIPETDLSVFLQVDLNIRTAFFDIAGIGATIEEVESSSFESINQTVGYTFLNDQLILDAPVEINAGTASVSIEAIELLVFDQSGSVLCPGQGDGSAVYSIALGETSGSLSKSLFQSGGIGFSAQSASFYSVNIPFVFDDSLRSLAEEGSIAALLPEASGFMMTYGFESDSLPANSVGFIVDLGNTSEYLLREIAISRTGNKLDIDLLDSYYFSNTATPEQQQALAAITEEIFANGIVYAFDLNIQNLTAFQLYNPCNQYEFMLVR